MVPLVVLILRGRSPLSHALPRLCSTHRSSTCADEYCLSFPYLQLAEVPIAGLSTPSHNLAVLQVLPFSRKPKASSSSMPPPSAPQSFRVRQPFSFTFGTIQRAHRLSSVRRSQSPPQITRSHFTSCKRSKPIPAPRGSLSSAYKSIKS